MLIHVQEEKEVDDLMLVTGIIFFIIVDIQYIVVGIQHSDSVFIYFRI